MRPTREELIRHYQLLASSTDVGKRKMALAQLRRLMPNERSSTNRCQWLNRPQDDSTEGLRRLVEAVVGRLHLRGNGDLDGPCPWHSSRSGRCLSIYAGGTRWFCRSCRRGGDIVAWASLIDGVSRAEARRRLGMGPAPRRALRRPILMVKVEG